MTAFYLSPQGQQGVEELKAAEVDALMQGVTA
ncbi:MAG: hypothetical protein QOI05_4582 [Bradyrhizobium sp.]|nr:hypothetical protein [Bradyrhizobium sp.]